MIPFIDIKVDMIILQVGRYLLPEDKEFVHSIRMKIIKGEEVTQAEEAKLDNVYLDYGVTE